jgi:2-polyprenyl-6-methoxyphenol hydroxylase-like FAD-dependent oxidoreductase
MYDVAIVGYGPVGALLAELLGKFDFSVVVIDKSQKLLLD